MWCIRNNPLRQVCMREKRRGTFSIFKRKNPTSWPQKGSPDPPPSLLKIIDLQCYIKINIYRLNLICERC